MINQQRLVRALTLTIYTIFSLHAFFAHADVNLCYSTESRSVQRGILNEGVGLNRIPRNTRHELALRASSLIYRLADLDISPDGQDFLSKHEEFQRQIPPGYTVEHYFLNRASSLKYMILSPLDPAAPWIFAFAGTQTAVDWMVDLNLGRAQFADIEGLLYAFTNCEYTDGHGQAMAARNWIITGHSLGGGLAEMFAYTAQKRRLQAGLAPANLELVTFNAFGALDVVESSPAAAQAVVSTLTTANYFVTGDVISRIGTHLGQTYELLLPAARLLEAPTRHYIDTVWKAVSKTGAVRFDLAQPALTPRADALNALKNYMSFFYFLPANQSGNLNYRLQHVNVLNQAVNIIVARGASGPYDREALHYIGNIALVFLRDEESKPAVGLRPQIVHDLKNILNRSSAAVQR